MKKPFLFGKSEMSWSPYGWTVSLLAVLLITTLVKAQETEPDPCNNHSVLDDYRRSTDYQATSTRGLICDRTLETLWYRFKLNGTSAELPTTCAEVNHCGTQAPIWLALGQDEHLPEVGTQSTLMTCTTWSFPGQRHSACCVFRNQVIVRNCGSFFVYYLKATQGCHMAYCATPSYASYQPQAIEAISLPSKPHIQPRISNNTVELVCSFGTFGHQVAPPERVFTVIWYKLLQPEDTRVLLRTVYDVRELQDTIQIAEFLKLGDRVVCEVQVYEETSNSVRNSTFVSEAFFLGIKVEPKTLNIQEDGSLHRLRFSLSIPYLCPTLSPNCKVVIQLKTRVMSSLMRPADISLSACEVAISTGECDVDCGSAEVKIKAVQDFMNDGTTQNVIETTLLAKDDPFWSGYDTLDVEVTTTNIPSSRCYAFTEPHFITFDKKRYDYYGTGTFVLYKSTTRNFEVHLRIWQCNNFPSLVSCACGFAAREDNELVVVDTCHGEVHTATPKVSVTTVDGEKPTVKLLESKEGKVLTVLFPSGTMIRAYLESWGMSLTLQAPSLDYGHTRGLCGIFDGSKSNDFHDINGAPMLFVDEFGQMDEFVNVWRLLSGDSLFDHNPPRVKSIKESFCTCYQPMPFDLMKSMSPAAIDRTNFLYLLSSANDIDSNCDYAKSNCLDTCRRNDDVSVQQLMEFQDISNQFVQADFRGNRVNSGSVGLSYLLNDQPKRNNSRDSSKSGKDQVDKHLPESKSERSDIALMVAPSFGPRENYVFTGDINSFDFNPVVPRWPTAKGLTEEKALEWCREVVLNTTVAKECSDYLGGNITLVVDVCILDITLMDDLSWAYYSLPLLDALCEEAALNDRLRWPRDALGNDIPPYKIVSAINCPNGCKRGTCQGNVCICQPGFIGDDCSQSEESDLPFVSEAGESGFCNVAKTPCSDIRVSGGNFNEIPSLSCMITEAQPGEVSWRLAESSMITPAKYIDKNHVECQLPVLSQLSVYFPGPQVSYEIKISNDNIKFSEATYLTVYDSFCQKCSDSQRPRCEPQTGACIIGGTCYLADQGNPLNECDICAPNASSRKWTPNPRNTAPVVQVPPEPLEAYEDELFEYVFKAYDPEGGKVRFVVKKSTPGLKVSSDGVLSWKAQANIVDDHEHLSLLVLDECNMTTEFNVQVLVLPCDCENGGKCVRTVPKEKGKSKCECSEGHSGKNCEISLNACGSSPCQNGICTNVDGDFRCECQPEYEGDLCDIRISPCSSNPCFKDVICNDTDSKAICGPCPPGLTGNGFICKEINDCKSNPCHSGVKCTDLLAPERGFICGPCPHGKTGNGITCIDIKTCDSVNPCFKGVNCLVVEGGHKCGPCPPGYAGDGITCTAVCKQACRRHEICAAPDTCQCRPGYTGTFCHIPICPKGCMNGGLCIRPEVCRCPYGFKGLRCETPICEPSCRNKGRCLGRNTCACPYGYVGKFCEISTCSHGCLNGGTCIAPNKCACPEGWAGPTCSQPTCKQGCLNGGTCLYPGFCACPPGYFGSDCSSGVCFPPCRNGGTCIRLNVCSCPQGWIGDRCSTPVCHPPCLNGGKCWRPNKCYCPSGWKGKLCQKPICTNRCKNGGTCLHPDLCQCPPEYKGLQCQVPVCSPKCLHGGRCVHPNVCKCPPGYEGAQCHLKLDLRRYTRHERHRTTLGG